MTTTLTPAELTPSEMADKMEVSLDTLRYYERSGLTPRVKRLPNGHRRYGEADVQWFCLVKCLRETGMPIRHIQRYADLAIAGDGTVPERVALLEEHRKAVIEQLDELRRNLDHLDGKLAYYAETFGT